MKTLCIKVPKIIINIFLITILRLKYLLFQLQEYCVGGSLDELPLMNVQILPFNLDHAKRTAEFARVIFEEKKISNIDLRPRAIIPKRF